MDDDKYEIVGYVRELHKKIDTLTELINNQSQQHHMKESKSVTVLRKQIDRLATLALVAVIMGITSILLLMVLLFIIFIS